MLIDDAVRFLSQIPPFQFLEGPVLRDVSKSLTMEFYPKGTVILQQDGPVSEFLRIIQKGVVKISLRPRGPARRWSAISANGGKPSGWCR